MSYSAMSTPIPKWLLLYYAKLWCAYGDNHYTFDDVKKLFKIEDNRRIGTILSRLVKHGWVSREIVKNNPRLRRLYWNRPPHEVLKEIGTEGRTSSA